MTENTSGENKGLFESLTVLATTLVAVVQTRLELLSVDLEEEREHLFSLLILSLTAMFFLQIGIVLAAILLVAAFWETHPLLVLGTLATVFLVIGIAVWIFVVHKAKTKPRLFSSSLSEMQKDRQQLGSRP